MEERKADAFQKAPDRARAREECRLNIISLQATRGYYTLNTHHKTKGYHWYTFTITPQDHKGNVAGLCRRVYKFNSYKSYVRSFFIHEISRVGMHHLHGIIQMKDQCKFKKVLKDKTYHYHIRPLNPTDDRWYNYILKDKPTAYRTHELGKDIIYQGFLGDRRGAPFKV